MDAPLPVPAWLGGLHIPEYEHDGCGVACVARLDGEPSHEVLTHGARAAG
jgi:glutamate synthase domain-containing protein 1